MERIILFNIADLFNLSHQPPLGLGYIKSYAYYKLRDRRKDFRIDILRKNIIKEIERGQPLIIGISSVTQYYTLAVETAEKIRKISPDSIIIIGGVHISTLPESLNKVFSLGVIGEGEVTFSEILKCTLDSKLTKENLLKIKGVIFFDGDEIRHAPGRELIQDLDEIPMVDRDDFGLKGLTHIMSSRGCPYDCSFCSSTHFWGTRMVRYHSADYVFNEMKYVVSKYNISYITFWDDLFVFNEPRLEKLSELMKSEHDIFKNVVLSVNCRANIVSEKLCRLMKSIGVKQVYMGLESGSDKILKEIKGGNVTVEQNRRAVEILKSRGFNVQASFVIGNPGETKEDLEQTYNFIKDLNLDGGCANIAIPMPATPYWNYALENGLVDDNMDFGRLCVNTRFQALKEENFILLSRSISKRDFIELGKKIEKELISKANKSIFSSKFLFNKNNLLIVLKNPKIAAKRLFGIVSGYLSVLFSKSSKS